MSEALLGKVTLENFLKEMEERGFKIGYLSSFQGHVQKGVKDEPTCETEVILFSEKDGLIVHAETKNEKFVRGVTVYAELLCKLGKLSSVQSEFFKTVTSMKQGKSGVGISIHFHRKISENIDSLRALFKLAKVWDTEVVPDFLNYAQKEAKNKNAEKMNTDKISKFPREMVQIMHL